MGGHQGVPNRSHLWAAPRCDTKGSVGETKRQRPLRRGAHCATPLFSDVAQRLCRPHERSTVDDTVVATTATPERGRPTANGGGRAACRGVAQRTTRRRAQAARPRARQFDRQRPACSSRDLQRRVLRCAHGIVLSPFGRARLCCAGAGGGRVRAGRGTTQLRPAVG